MTPSAPGDSEKSTAKKRRRSGEEVKKCKDKKQWQERGKGEGRRGSKGMSYSLWSCGACGANFAGSDSGHAHFA